MIDEESEGDGNGIHRMKRCTLWLWMLFEVLVSASVFAAPQLQVMPEAYELSLIHI